MAGEINDGMPNYIIQRITSILNNYKKAISGSKLLILGLSYKKNISDLRESPNLEILQELITHKNKKFLIVGIGINLVSNPIIKNKYQATNILAETKKKIEINNVINLIILAYKDFFLNLKKYKYNNFKKKAEMMAIK